MPETTTISLPADLVQELARRGAERGLDASGYLEWLVKTHGGTPVRVPTPLNTPGTVMVRAASRHYGVHVGGGLLKRLGELVRTAAPGRRAYIVADGALPQAFLDLASGSLTTAGFAMSGSRLPATEDRKSIESATQVLQQLLTSKHERTDPIISLGGGIVTDLAGFVAATYRRGVPVIHCPTTLLAMVDAAVGGKTGVNLALPDGSLAKNMVGAFWQPHLVLCDTDTLRTLPLRQLRAGMAECLKHGLLAAGLPEGQGRDASLWRWTLDHLDACLRLDAGPLAELIARNIAVKAGVVSNDEREEAPSSAGGRALLNLGHTFAHAIETLPGLEPTGPGLGPTNVGSPHAPASEGRFMLHHGEAVGLGLIAAAAASRSLGMLSEADAGSVRSAVERTGLPTALRGLPDDAVLIERMSHDKKNTAGTLRLILLKSLGEAVVVENPPMDAARAGWAAIRA
jgi:3-dehydroquinate synthetase